MCGICLVVCSGGSQDCVDRASCNFGYESWLDRRGPDSQTYNEFFLNFLFVAVYSTFLKMRGWRKGRNKHAPLESEDDNDDMLLFNGEIFGGIPIPDGARDTDVLLALLKKASQTGEDLDVVKTLEQIRGPYSMIYLQQAKGRIWFGRDVLGRRSLLASVFDGLVLCSVAASPLNLLEGTPQDCSYIEIPAGVIFCLDLMAENSDEIVPAKNLWSHTSLKVYPLRPHCVKLEEFLAACNNVGMRVIQRSSLTITNTFDSIFDLAPVTPDLYSIPEAPSLENVAKLKLLTNLLDQLNSYVLQFYDVLKTAVTTRVSEDTDRIWKPAELSKYSRVGLLFSGGVDSLLLAAIVHQCLPSDLSIDLLNVAFVLPQHDGIASNGTSSAPDRVTGLEAYSQLCIQYPDRKWRFVEIDVSLADVTAAFKDRISLLLKPNTENIIDNSLGIGFWFAARGKGTLDGQPYCSRARVLLSGTGADELMGGYARHRTRFQSGGWPALQEELEMELRRISARNLGRDDRMVADHGKELRLPFLDESLIAILNAFPLNAKVDLNLERGLGEKLLLRLTLLHLGFTLTSLVPKRAFQFGSNIAKLLKHNDIM